MPRAASPTPRRSKQWKALGPSWMPAPISPSLEAFSSTSEAMPFWASARAAARPPMPPPAMRTLSGSTHDLLVMQPGDLMVRQPEDSRKDLVRMLAQGGRDPGRPTRDGAELQRRGRHRIAADAGLVEDCEQRVVVYRLLERRAHVGRGAGGHPGFDHGAEPLAVVPAAGIGLEVDAAFGLDLPEGRREAAGRSEEHTSELH